MTRINRPTINADVVHVTLVLKLSLGAVVMRMTKRLQLTKPEQLLVTMMWYHMIGNVSQRRYTMLFAHTAHRLASQLLLRSVAPALFGVEMLVLMLFGILAHQY